MTAFAVLSLANNATTAIAFNPVGIDASGVARWMTTSEASLDARRGATMSVGLPKNGSNVVRVKQRVAIPVMDTVDTTKKVAEAYVNIEFVLPKQASDTVRLDLRAFAANFISHAATTAAVTNFESQY
jgi:hypothetical protein